MYVYTYIMDMTKLRNGMINGTVHGMGKFHRKVLFHECSLNFTSINTDIPYRRKFSRHEKFTKSLKTGFSRLFICETTPDIHESHANVFSIKLHSIWSIIAVN